jgi:uncharacterized protein YaiI (UPF0178 family)
MLNIYIDDLTCRVKSEIFRIARNNRLKVFVISQKPVRVPSDGDVHAVSAGIEPDAIKMWIVTHIKTDDILISDDMTIAHHSINLSARAISNDGIVIDLHNVYELENKYKFEQNYMEAGFHKVPYNTTRPHFVKSFTELIYQVMERSES